MVRADKSDPTMRHRDEEIFSSMEAVIRKKGTVLFY